MFRKRRVLRLRERIAGVDARIEAIMFHFDASATTTSYYFDKYISAKEQAAVLRVRLAALEGEGDK